MARSVLRALSWIAIVIGVFSNAADDKTSPAGLKRNVAHTASSGHRPAGRKHAVQVEMDVHTMSMKPHPGALAVSSTPALEEVDDSSSPERGHERVEEPASLAQRIAPLFDQAGVTVEKIATSFKQFRTYEHMSPRLSCYKTAHCNSDVRHAFQTSCSKNETCTFGRIEIWTRLDFEECFDACDKQAKCKCFSFKTDDGQPTDGQPTGTGSCALLEACNSGKFKESESISTYVRVSGGDIFGLKKNAKGDLIALESALAVNSLLVLIFFTAFAGLRLKYPIIYSHNNVNSSLSSTLTDWIMQSIQHPLEETIRQSGLDAAMQIEFMDFSMKLILMLAVPLTLITIPVNLYLAGDLSECLTCNYSMEDIDEGSRAYWVHVVAVWFVVVTVQDQIYRAQLRFLPLRVAWLREMPEPRSTTLLVEGIPKKYCDDFKLKEYFALLMSPQSARDQSGGGRLTDDQLDIVKSAYIVRRNGYIARLQEEAAEDVSGETGSAPSTRSASPRGVAQRANSENRRSSTQIIRRAETIQDLNRQSTSSADFTSNGFVTFASRCDAEKALKLRYTHDRNEFVMSLPPGPEDVNWDGLQLDFKSSHGVEMQGYFCLAVIFFTFVPLFIWLSDFREYMLKYQPGFTKQYPLLEEAGSAVGGAMLVTLLTNVIVPKTLFRIARSFFQSCGPQRAQLRMYVWMFYFFLVFVVLVSAFSGDTLRTVKILFTRFEIIQKNMANNIPYASNFYIKFLLTQWVPPSFQLLRAQVLIKYSARLALLNTMEASDLNDSERTQLHERQEKARQQAEPECQVSNGIGARNAQLSLNLVIALIFCTWSPLLLLPAFVYFLIARLSFGYLLNFAETRKADLGGAFWVEQLRHLQLCLVMYVIVMVGVLRSKAGFEKAAVAFCSLIYWYWSWSSFHSALEWESLPFEELFMEHEESQEEAKKSLSKRAPKTMHNLQSGLQKYVQPGLLECGYEF